MIKAILHGGYTGTKNKLNRTYYEECTKGLANGSNVLFVYFARDEKDIPRLYEEDKERILETTKVKNLNLVLATREKFPNQLKVANTIYIRGGETEKLLNTLNKFPEFKSGLEGKIIAGSSAGAYILAKCYHSASKGGVHEGMGIFPIKVICHYQSKIDPNTDDPIEAIKKCPEKLDLVVLKDFEWKVIVK